jgi:hypothetical protein
LGNRGLVHGQTSSTARKTNFVDENLELELPIRSIGGLEQSVGFGNFGRVAFELAVFRVPRKFSLGPTVDDCPHQNGLRQRSAVFEVGRCFFFFAWSANIRHSAMSWASGAWRRLVTMIQS